jgi:biotin transport system substrate-specific component
MTTSSIVALPNSISKFRELLESMIQIIGASLFIAICAQISVPLFFTPVPLSCQTLAILLVGGLLGAKRGALSVLLYLAEGSAGLPFFAGGYSGFAYLFGTDGGYFFGFLVQAYLVGWFFESQKKLYSSITFTVLVFSCALQMLLGVLWLAFYVGWSQVLILGFYPFIPGEILKCLAATKYMTNRSRK